MQPSVIELNDFEQEDPAASVKGDNGASKKVIVLASCSSPLLVGLNSRPTLAHLWLCHTKLHTTITHCAQRLRQTWPHTTSQLNADGC